VGKHQKSFSAGGGAMSLFGENVQQDNVVKFGNVFKLLTERLDNRISLNR
jgi:hypothetical protein